MAVRERFVSALAWISDQPGWGGRHRLPDRLAHAAAAALGAPAAGMVALAGDGFPFPLAASTPAVREAELVEFDVGEGPVTHAAISGRMVAADYAVINRCWPFYAGLLQDRAPFTRTLATPVPGVGVLAVHDLPLGGGSDGAGGTDDADIPAQARVVAQMIAEVLGDPEVFDQVAWSQVRAGDPWVRRSRAWTAAGMVMSALQVDMPAAVSVLRSHAFRSATTVQDTASTIIDGSMRPEDLLR